MHQELLDPCAFSLGHVTVWVVEVGSRHRANVRRRRHTGSRRAHPVRFWWIIRKSFHHRGSNNDGCKHYY